MLYLPAEVLRGEVRQAGQDACQGAGRGPCDAAYCAGERLRAADHRSDRGQDSSGRHRDAAHVGGDAGMRAADRRVRAEPARGRGGLFGDEERAHHRAGRRARARRRASTPPGRCPRDTLMVRAAGRRVRRRRGDVPRPGAHRAEAARHAPRGERHARPADRPHQRGPRHRVRHRRARPRGISWADLGREGRSATGRTKIDQHGGTERKMSNETPSIASIAGEVKTLEAAAAVGSKEIGNTNRH